MPDTLNATQGLPVREGKASWLQVPWIPKEKGLGFRALGFRVPKENLLQFSLVADLSKDSHYTG